ncbi:MULTISPECIES: hypothetical protein [Kribbella]|uniref:Uncharacterized protein n=1 Tax=Kribbella karoonensis TaxID=324851 RepID=A0ABN2EM18_9ACTN
MDYGEFDAERRRIVRAWGTEITDTDQLVAAVERLRAQAPTIADDADRAKAMRYLTTLDDLVEETRTPESPTIRQASDVLLRASGPEGTPAERRARAEAAMAEIARIAAAAPTVGERDAALEMNGTLMSIIAVIDLGPAAD